MDECAAIFVNWNGRHLLETALPSLPSDLEVWVVDNASEDDSVSWLEKNYPDVHLILNDQNEGFARANNKALARITKPYVLMLNSDAAIVDNSLEHALTFLKSQPTCGLVGAQLLHDNGKLQASVTPKLDLWSECLNRRLVAALRQHRSRGFTEPQPVAGVIGAAMLARTEALKAVDCFDEQFFFFLEETDLCQRLNQAGWQVWHHPRWRVRHSQGQSARTRDLAKRVEFQLSRELYFVKHFGRHATCTLRNWQERRLWWSAFWNRLGSLVTLGAWTARRHKATQHLLKWYRLGSPENWGLRPEGWAPPRQDTIGRSV